MTKKELLKYLKNTEFDIQNANAVMLLAKFVFNFYANSHKAHGINFSPICAYFSHKDLNLFFQIIKKDFIVEVSEKIYSDYQKDSESLDQKIRGHNELTEKMDRIWDEYKKSKKKGIDKYILKKYYIKLEKISRQWWYYGAIGEDKGAIIERKIIPSFAQRNDVSLGEAHDIISTLSHPKELSVFNLERKEFLEICLLVKELKNKKNKTLDNKIKLYLKHYFWNKTDFCRAKEVTKEGLLEDVSKELKKKTKNEIQKELLRIDRNFKKIKEKKKNIIKKIKLSAEDKKDIYFSQRDIYWIDQRKLGMMKNIYYMFNVLYDISSFYKVKKEEIFLYSVEDLRELLNTGKKPRQDMLKNRRNSTFLLCEKEKTSKFFYGQTAKDMFKIATHVENEELKGVVASKGNIRKIKGKVRVVINPAKTSFRDGEILVTSMTRIEFVPLMRRAKAIITNEGGLACHAAIVSRELGIPAIIGTKNATNVIKTGDMIEMDMENGIISKIN